MLANPALSAPEAKAAEDQIARFVAAPVDHLQGYDRLMAEARNQALTGQAVGQFRDLVTNQGLPVEQAKNQAIAKNSRLFDDTATPPASLQPLGILSYPDKLSDIDFDTAKQKIIDLAASGRIGQGQRRTMWLDLNRFQNDVYRRDQMKGQVRAVKDQLKGDQ